MTPSDRVALVAGAASGIGRATARWLARDGATVWCADLNGEGAQLVAEGIRGAGGRAAGLALDVTNEDAWEAGMATVLSEHPGLDVLVNSAGISAAGPLAETSCDEWRRVMSVNLDGAFLAIRHGIRAMATRGGVIVTVASASGLRAQAGAAAYSTSKAAVVMLTKAAAKECVEQGRAIRINSVSPGAVRTPLWTTMPFFRDLVAKTGSEDAAFAELAKGSPGGFADPDEVAAAIAFLASDAARFITGADLPVDSGFSV